MTYFIDVLEITLPVGVLILMLYAAQPLLKRAFVVKWRYFMWLFVALRLIIPMHFTPSHPALTLTVPPITEIPFTAEYAADPRERIAAATPTSVTPTAPAKFSDCSDSDVDEFRIHSRRNGYEFGALLGFPCDLHKSSIQPPQQECDLPPKFPLHRLPFFG